LRIVIVAAKDSHVFGTPPKLIVVGRTSIKKPGAVPSL
jgi:hypothetical protein